MKTPALAIGTCLLTALLSVNAWTALAVENTVAVPYVFAKGGKIKAAEMNDNFSALSDAINDIALTPGPQGLQGPTGATGLSIDAASTYVGGRRDYFRSLHPANNSPSPPYLFL